MLVILGNLNDLWLYRVNDNTWTWISGSDTVNQPGVYGEKGNASTDNTPGARRAAVGCYDSSKQEFWIFGGHGHINESSISGTTRIMFVFSQKKLLIC